MQNTNVSTNRDRREVIFDLLKIWFGKKTFRLEFAWHELRNSRVRRLYPDLELEDVQDWLFSATDVSGELPPEVAKNPTLGFKCEVQTYAMLDVETSIRRWEPRVWIQRELRRLALSSFEKSSKCGEESPEVEPIEFEEWRELKRRVSESIGRVREEFEGDPKGEEVRAVGVESRLEAWVRRRFLDGNLVYDESGRRVRGLRFEPRFRRGVDGTYEFSGLEVVPFPSRGEVKFEKFVDDLVEDLVHDPIDAATKVIDSSTRIQMLGCKGWRYEHLEVFGWDGPGWYFWDENFVGLHGPFDTEEEVRSGMKVHDGDDERIAFLSCHEVASKAASTGEVPNGWNGPGWYLWGEGRTDLYGPFGTEVLAKEWLERASSEDGEVDSTEVLESAEDDRIQFLSIATVEGREVPGWNGPGWYVWDAPKWKVFGPFETEVLASEWWNAEKQRVEKRSIDVDGHRKLVFYSPFGHEVEVRGWRGSGYYFWADDGSAVHGPYDSEFAASNARDEYEKALERERNR